VAELREERRIVTALFADVVGSTALAERLDPEEVKLIVGEAIARAIGVVESYGGSIKDLAGDGVLAIFGAPIAHEDDPERAVRAALDLMVSIREYAEEVRRGFGAELAMRAGIHTGQVVVGEVGAGSRVEYGAVGDAVNTTARLQAAADPGGVLISDTTYRQVASLFEWGEPRTLQLKGKAEPVVAYPVKGLKDVSGGRATAEPVAPMVGRDPELALGLELIDRLRNGRGGILFIVGEPGIGKSRLAAELRERASRSGNLAWLEGRCVSYGDALPYWPYRDLLRNWLQVSATEPEIRVRVKLRRKTEESFPGGAQEVYPYLGTVLGLNLEADAAAHLASLSPESLQYRTFEVLTELFGKISAAHPLVISLDDLHWADSTSLALTERLLALAEAGPVMVNISHRPDTDHASWDLKEKAAREYRHLFREVALKPLAHDSESVLLSSLAGGRAVPEEIAEQVLGYAEGNPFYLEQMVRSLIDSGTLVPENGRWRFTGEGSLQIPQTLEGVIIARIDRLQPDWREVLTSASVLGRTFGHGLLQAVTGLELPALRQALHNLLRLDLLREEGVGKDPIYRFKHALIQETAYRTLVAAKRTSLHRRAAEWFEAFYRERPDRVYGLIAHHWLAAADAGKAAQYLRLAGDRARDEWALDEAIGHYRQLTPLLEKTGRQQEAAEVLFQLGTTLHLAMRYHEANDVWQEAFQCWRPPPPAAEPATATLRLAVGHMPWDTEPNQGMYAANQRLIDQVNDRLLDPCAGRYVVPGLARRWQVSDDGLRYRLELAPGARWNDGRPVTAMEVVYAIQKCIDHAPQMPGFLVLENAEAVAAGQLEDMSSFGARALDERSIEFRLTRPAPHFIHMLTWPQMSPRRADLAFSGPFRLEKLTADEVVIVRDPRHHRRRRGNVGRVEWRLQTGPGARARIENGETDVVAGSANDPSMAGEGGTEVKRVVGASVQSLFMNLAVQRADLHLRRALAYATDRSRLERLLVPGQMIATGGLVPPGLPGHTPDIAPRFDADLARESLRRSAHRGQLRVAVAIGWRAPYVDALVDCWREVLGLTVSLEEDVIARYIQFYDWAHVALDHWMAGYPDPEYYLHGRLHSRSPLNHGRWSYPAFDDLVDRALLERTGSRRLALFHEADRVAVVDQHVVIPLAYAQQAVLVRGWVHGWWEWGAPWMSFDDLTIDERSPRYNSRPPLAGEGKSGG